ncbi:ABC transporter ATP-binding protein [Actinopolyspora alba]|uniref:ABC transporter ATP-binding protein n=1 Tax=Actinopolyspora alba TaxID=673379 RepID=UPI001586FE95|nr:ATP-binding cassette domain-containing protein [Actinopolyspora alba]
MANNAIETHGLSYEYNSGFGIHGIDLRISSGSITAIRGDSGSGKSTLLALLGLLLRPTSGELFLNGYNSSCMSPKERDYFRKKEIGIILQDLALLPFLNSWENVSSAFGPHLKKNRKLAQDVLSEVGLGNYCETPAGNLSGGERQRVAIARAQVKEPSLILADEPTGSLDSNNSKAVMCLLRRLTNKNTSVLIATHSTDVTSACDAEVRLDQGNIISSLGNDHFRNEES